MTIVMPIYVSYISNMCQETLIPHIRKSILIYLCFRISIASCQTHRTVFSKFREGNIKFENVLQGDASQNFVLKLSYSIRVAAELLLKIALLASLTFHCTITYLGILSLVNLFHSITDRFDQRASVALIVCAFQNFLREGALHVAWWAAVFKMKKKKNTCLVQGLWWSWCWVC